MLCSAATLALTSSSYICQSTSLATIKYQLRIVTTLVNDPFNATRLLGQEQKTVELMISLTIMNEGGREKIIDIKGAWGNGYGRHTKRKAKQQIWEIGFKVARRKKGRRGVWGSRAACMWSTASKEDRVCGK